VKTDIIALSKTLTAAHSPPAPELALIEQIFDHLPETAFFIKDKEGRYLSVNQSLVERCGFEEKQQLLGRHVTEVFPKRLADLYAAQDQTVLRTGRPIIDHLELHWYARRQPGWCLTTKRF
jgi:PAS domain S-box-containing protein